MKFALLGDDPRIGPLLQAVGNDPAQQLAWAVAAGGLVPELVQRFPRLRIAASWQELLSDVSLDAVLVAGAEEPVLEGARRLAAEGKSLLLLPQPAQEATFVYELSLIRDDRPVTLFPIFPRRVHPLVLELWGLARQARLGPLVHLEMETQLAVTSLDAGLPLLTPARVDAALLDDLDLLRMLSGEFDQITAVHSGATAGGFTRATVSLAGAQAVQATWTAVGVGVPPSGGPPAGAPAVPAAGVAVGAGVPPSGGPPAGTWRLTVTGRHGTATLSGSEDPSQMSLVVSGISTRAPATDRVNWGPAVLAQFTGGVALPPAPVWSDGVRAFELLHAAHRSLTRRRTIDLHFETPSERGNFKTQMTAIGCGVLLFTLLGMLLFLGLGAAAKDLGLPPWLLQIARVAVFAPLGIFLLLQGLLFLTKGSKRG